MKDEKVMMKECDARRMGISRTGKDMSWKEPKDIWRHREQSKIMINKGK